MTKKKTEESSQDEFEHKLRQQKEKQAEICMHAFENFSLEPYADEPLANEEWLLVYINEQQEIRRLKEELKKRLENIVRVGDW